MFRSPRFQSVFFLCVLACSPAFAQDDPELGETAPGAAGSPAGAARKKAGKRGAPAPAPEPPPPPVAPPPPPVEAPPAMDPEFSKPSESEDEKKGDTDHDAVIGKFGIGLLGMAEIPVGVGAGVGGAGPVTTTHSPLTAPVLGARYWVTSRWGLEAGVGFAFSGGNVNVTGQPAADNASTRAFALHAGVPISVKSGKHYNLLVVPYAGFGISSATDTRATAVTADDIFGKGFLIEGGLKGGVEVQLGAIGLEGFALQLTGGVRLRYESTTANVPLSNPAPGGAKAYDVQTSNLVFATSPGSTLGSAIAGTIAALYYF